MHMQKWDRGHIFGSDDDGGEGGWLMEFKIVGKKMHRELKTK